MLNPDKKISSAHEDLQTPKASHDLNLKEYIEYPQRGTETVLNRLSQWLTKDIFDGIKSRLGELSELEIAELVSNVIESRYDTIVAATFDKKILPGSDHLVIPDRIRAICEMAEKYKSQWGLNVVERAGQRNPDGANLIISLEGADPVKTTADIKRLFDAGIRIIGPQYNQDNAFGERNQGLSQTGEELVKFMASLGIGIDLAHSSPAIRRDTMNLVIDQLGKGEILSYTHGSVIGDAHPDWTVKIAPRLISENELAKIINNGGFVGLGVTYPFFQNLEGLTDRIDRVLQDYADKGLRALGLGTDFGGVWPEATGHTGLNSAADMYKLADMLISRFNMSEGDIDKIIRTNVPAYTERIMAGLKEN